MERRSSKLEWNNYAFTEKDGALKTRKIMALFPISCLIMQMIVNAGSHFVTFYTIIASETRYFTAFDLTRVANDFCMIILNALVIAVWSTVCFKTTNMQHLWSWKSWLFGGSNMQGLGFVPKPAAASVGFLLFISGVFVSERVVKGSELPGHIASGEWCRADIKEVSNFGEPGVWFSRLERQIPFGCYFGPNITNIETNETTHPLAPKMFNSTALSSPLPFNLVVPFHQSDSLGVAHAVLSALPLQMRDFVLRQLPEGYRQRLKSQSILDPTYICMYQCTKWKSWGFQDVMTKLGTVVAGAAVVIKVTESVTSVLGLSRVKLEHTPSEVARILEKTQSWKTNRFHEKYLYKNPLLCALLLVGVRWLAMLVYKIDDHGLYTVDYYVSMTLIFSVFTSGMLRSFNPYTFMWIAYTDDMWKNGTAEFIIYDSQSKEEEEKQGFVDADKSAKPRMIDLFMWLHLGHLERNYLLINHARKVSAKAKVNDNVECNVPFQFEQVRSLDGVGGGVYARTLEISHGDTGKIVSIEGSQAVVVWKRDDVTLIGEDDQKGEADIWKNEKMDTKIDLAYIRDSSAEWDELQLLFVGEKDQVKETRKLIITAIVEANTEMGHKSLAAKFMKKCWTFQSTLCCRKVDQEQTPPGYALL